MESKYIDKNFKNKVLLKLRTWVLHNLDNPNIKISETNSLIFSLDMKDFYKVAMQSKSAT